MGLIFSSFMLGLFISALAISRKLAHTRAPQRLLPAVELSLFLLCALMLWVFYQFPMIPAGGIAIGALEACLYILNFLLGSLVGIEFPVANAFMEREGKESGGILYACDLVGAFAGSLVLVTLLLPLLGFPLLLMLVGSLKLVNVFLVLSRIR
jgi:predicted membrane-bound spermidine synthase